MSRYIISVGGSGQHIALALTRLRYLGAIRDLKLIAIDPDRVTKLPMTLASPTPSLSGNKHPLLDGVVKPPFDIDRYGEKTFAEIFIDPNAEDRAKEKELFECLFDADEAGIEVHRGMYGTPCVGATVFGEGTKGQQLMQLFAPLRDAESVFICGSVVGGTGAGLMHKLVAEVRSLFTGDLFGIFMLPWFDLPATGTQGTITSATISRNASHGVKYFYRHTIPHMTASLLVGHPGTRQSPVLQRAVFSDGEMRERPHYLHLVSAFALVSLPEEATKHKSDSVKAYAFAHDLQQEGWLLDRKWESNYTLRRLIRARRIQNNLLSFLTLPQNRAKIVKSYSGIFFDDILGGRDSWGSLDSSIQENASDKKQRAGIADKVVDRFEELRKETQFCIDWAEALFPERLDEPNDSLMIELSEAFKKREESPVHWKKLQMMWLDRHLAANQNSPNTAQDIANFHANILFEEALKL